MQNPTNTFTAAQLPLFAIVGNPRSGTNMLRGFLDSHPETIVCTEFPFIPLYYPLFKKKNLSAHDVDIFIGLLKKKIKFKFWSIERWHIDIDLLHNDLLNCVSQGLTYAVACKIVVSRFVSVFPKNKISVLIVKEPSYSMQTKVLTEIFPEIRFVHLFRDPRGQVNSVQRLEFGSHLFSANAFVWNIFQKHLNWFGRKNKDKMYRLQYEALVADPLRELIPLCHFLGIDYNEKMLDYRAEKSKLEEYYGLNDPDIINLGKSTMTKPDIAKTDEWKRQLSKTQIKTIEAGCRKQMKKMGYEPLYRFGCWHWLKFVPVSMHAALQAIISFPVKLLPFKLRLKVIMSPSLFENTYARLFGASKVNRK